MKSGLVGRLGRASPVLLAGAYAEAVTLGLHPGVPGLLGALAFLLLLVGIALPAPLAVPVALYGFVGCTLGALILGSSPAPDVPRAFPVLGWFAFALSWGALSETARASEASGVGTGAGVELVSEGHEPIRRGGRGMAFLVLAAAAAALFTLVWGPELPSVEQRILSQVVFTGLGVLLLSLAGECAGSALELRSGPAGGVHPARLVSAVGLWLLGSVGLVGAAERLAHQAFGLALLGGLLSAAAGGLGLRLVRSAREN